MGTNLLKWLAVMWAGCFFAACDEDLDDRNGTDRTPKDATLLLYMVGQNDLRTFLTDNITDLRTGLAALDANANVLVYADISSTPTLYHLEKNRSGDVTQTTVKTYPDQYSVDPDVMASVVNDVFSLYPAERYGLVLSSHADGSLYTSNTVNKRSFGTEGNQGYGMNITDIQSALANCPYLEMVAFDACMMSSVETAYELRNESHYLFAAPNSVPAAGFPYDELIANFLQMDEAHLVAAAKAYMHHYLENSETWDDFVSICVTDLSKMDSLALYMDSLFQNKDVQDRVPTIDRETLQRFENGYALYDYGEWVDSLGISSPYAAKVRQALSEAVCYAGHSDYASVNDYTATLIIPIKEGGFCGLNTYVPFQYPAIERSRIEYFTTTSWYKDAGICRSAFYNQFETANE